jgi:superoxide reductase
LPILIRPDAAATTLNGKEVVVANRLEIYKCDACGKSVEVLTDGEGELLCCGEPMRPMRANTVDAAREKHVPVIKKTGGAVAVQVGDAPHPMEENHFIEWIDLMAEGQIHRQYLDPGEAPEAEFTAGGSRLTARAYCNLHGLWKGEV